MDLISSYFVSPAELSSEQRKEARARIVTWLQLNFPGVDFRPNSVVGDNMVTPWADLLSALEEAVRRLISDLNPGNVERGVVYNCDVAQAFLANLGVASQIFLPARGQLRLTFSDTAERELDRSVQFFFGSGQTFSPQMFSDRSVMTFSSTPAANSDRYLYRQVADGWEVLIPLEGVSADAAPAAGAQPATSVEIPGLVRAEAAADFFAGDSAPTVVEQATRLRTILATPSLETRLGAVSALMRRFSEFAAVGVVSSIDDAYLLEPGQVGLHVRAREPYIELREIVALPYDAVSDRFYGKWTPKVAPLRILQLNNGAFSFDPQDADIAVFAQATGEYPLFLSGFSGEEEFAIGIPMPRDGGGAAQIIPSPLNDAMVGYFEVVYWVDAAAENARRFISDRLNRPLVPTYVRPLIPYLCSGVDIGFIRQPGVETQLQNARELIRAYLHTLGGVRRFSLSKLSAIMRNAGAYEVTSVRFTATALFSAAKAHVPVGVDLADEAACEAAAVAPLVADLDEVESYEETPVAVDPAKFCAIGPENRGLLVELANINFREVRS